MDKFNFDQVIKRMEAAKSTLPTKLANQAQNYFVQTFTRQEFAGAKWKEVQRRIPGTKAYLYPKSKGLSRQTKPILVGTGKLRQAVAASVRDVSFEMIRLVVALPYAAFVNYGKDKRKFMGDSLELRKQQKVKIINEYNKVWHL